MTSSYVDIDREVNDFVTKGFPANNSVKFGFEASVPEGILLKGNIDRQFKENKDKGVKEITNLTFEPSITLKDLKVKSKIGTNPDKEASVEFSNLFTNGISLELGAKERSQNHFATVGYKTQQFNVQATASAPFDRTHANSSYKIDASAVLNYPNDMYWGLQAAVARPCVSVSPTGKDKDVKAGWQPSLSGKLHLISLNTTLSVEPGRQKPEKPLPYTLSILFNQKLTPNIRVATKFTCSTDIEESSTLDVALEQKNVDGSIFKSRASVLKHEKDKNNDLQFNFAYTNKFPGNRLSYTVGAAVNALEFFGIRRNNPVSLGFELKFK